MENVEDSVSMTGFEPLFIKEEDLHPNKAVMEQRVESNRTNSGLTFAQTQLNQSASMKPYLQEMDELLKSCEELTGIPFGSHFSATYSEESLTESTDGRGEVGKESNGETSTFPHSYLTTSYIDTHMDQAGTEGQPGQIQSQAMSSNANRCGLTTGVCQQTDMPLTTAGSKLSDTMVAYEGQLLGMLTMLENCMEEAGMDFEPQDWTIDESQEYVHISKNPHFYGGTTLASTQEKMYALESQAAPPGWAGKHTGEDENRNSATIPLEPVYDEVMREEYMSTNNGGHREEGTTGADAENTEFRKMDGSDFKSSMNELGALGTQMEEYIQEVQHLQKRRKELLSELLELRGHKSQEEEEEEEEAQGNTEEEEETQEQISSKVAELMAMMKKEEESRREERKKELQSLREDRAEEERKIWRVNLERHGLQQQLMKLKRRMFAMAREGAHSQAALNTQRREVELLKREEEKLQSLLLQLTEEGSRLRSAHQQQLFSLQAELQAQSTNQNTSSQEELSQYKRKSCGDVQQYLQGSLKALEDRYEPILLALLKRREATLAALVTAKEQTQQLRAQLGPLRDEMQKLGLQRACLEEKLKLVHLQRREDVGQYKETVCSLEENSRELKRELTLQKRKTQDVEELRDSLTKKVLLYRAAIEEHKEKT